MNIPAMLAQAVIEHQFTTVSTKLGGLVLLEYIMTSLTVNWHLGGGTTPPPKISETTGCMIMKFLPDVKLSGEARNQKNFFEIT